ncbi:hypothetical protein B0H14DRAFT_2639030 [Mycena olivaceomarginata]|nr:hypothetical protein B0H14DRAFT_2639030 [Mycena olivaceomarginata]
MALLGNVSRHQPLPTNADQPVASSAYITDDDILRTFDGLDTFNIPIDNEEDTVEDIHKFVKAQLDGTDVVHMVDDVAEAAQTLFECAAVLCRELTSSRRPASASARSEFIRKLREGPVMSLYGSYHAILKMYFGDEDAELSRRVFRAFAAALLPDTEQPDVDKILRWLGSLLSGTTSENDPISPLHTSLRDFLLDMTKSGTFSVDLGPCSQQDLSRACLRIMNTGLQFNICGLLTSFALNSEVEDLPQKIEKCISPSLRYACQATAHHLRCTVPSTATMSHKINTPAGHAWSRPITKPLRIVACGALVYMNTSLAVLLMMVVLAICGSKYKTLSALFTTSTSAVTSLHTVECLYPAMSPDVVEEGDGFFSA